MEEKAKDETNEGKAKKKKIGLRILRKIKESKKKMKNTNTTEVHEPTERDKERSRER